MQTINRKSLLYRGEVEYADFCLNHVEGCAHGCKFPCYAMQLAKRFGKIKNIEEWMQPKLVSNALELLEKELPKHKGKINFVHLCFMTDPFMYRYPEVREMTLKIIQKLNANNIKVTSLTKGIVPRKLVDKSTYSEDNEYGITLVSLDDKFHRNFEQNSAPYKKRINALRYLSKSGCKTWVSMEPYPTPNLVEQDLLEILETISFVDKIVFGKLNYNVKSTQFKYNQEFYHKCVEIVKAFCKKHNIEYHIKEGTIKDGYVASTERLFQCPDPLPAPVCTLL